MGKQQVGDYLWKEEVFTFSDGTRPKVLKELVDLIVGPLYRDIFSEKLSCWWDVLDSWKKINTISVARQQTGSQSGQTILDQADIFFYYYLFFFKKCSHVGKGKALTVTYLDFSKAFVTISCTILI